MMKIMHFLSQHSRPNIPGDGWNSKARSLFLALEYHIQSGVNDLRDIFNNYSSRARWI